MRTPDLATAALSALLAGAVLLAAPPARAIDCPDQPNPVYVTGSSAAKPFLAEIGKLMAGQTPPVTVVYLGQGSCGGVTSCVGGVTDTAATLWGNAHVAIATTTTANARTTAKLNPRLSGSRAMSYPLVRGVLHQLSSQ